MAVSWGFPDLLLVAAEAVVHLTGADRRGRDSRISGEERPGPGRLRSNHTLQSPGLGALFAMQHNGWDHGLKVTDDGAGLAGHCGGVLLRKLADQCGLTAALDAALTRAGTFP
jgi:hypothetical protein